MVRGRSFQLQYGASAPLHAADVVLSATALLEAPAPPAPPAQAAQAAEEAVRENYMCAPRAARPVAPACTLLRPAPCTRLVAEKLQETRTAQLAPQQLHAPHPVPSCTASHAAPQRLRAPLSEAGAGMRGAPRPRARSSAFNSLAVRDGGELCSGLEQAKRLQRAILRRAALLHASGRRRPPPRARPA